MVYGERRMTKRKRMLRELADAAIALRYFNPHPSDKPKLREIWFAGHRSGKREGKTEAMGACGWGKEK